MKTFRAHAITLALTIAAVLPAAAQDWAKASLAKSPRHGEYVTITEPSGRKLNAWIVYPEIKDKAAVVVMIHEIFGLSDWAREMADEVAGAGYIVVEPDLLSGYGPPLPTHAMQAPPMGTSDLARTHGAGLGCDPMDCASGQKPLLERISEPQIQRNEGHRPMPSPGVAYVPATPGGTSAFPDQGAIVKAVSSLPREGVLADLDAAADYGKHLSAANGKLFVAGFCWGGGNSFLFATHRKDLSGAFVFYGAPPSADAMKNLTAPVYGFYAENDARITSTVPQTEAAMKAAGKTYEPKVYDGAGHGFMRTGEAPDASAANTAARQEGFRRFIALLGGIH